MARKFKGGKPEKLMLFCRVGERLPDYEGGSPWPPGTFDASAPKKTK